MIELEIKELVEGIATNRQRLKEILEKPRQGSLTELALNVYTERRAFLEKERKQHEISREADKTSRTPKANLLVEWPAGNPFNLLEGASGLRARGSLADAQNADAEAEQIITRRSGSWLRAIDLK